MDFRARIAEQVDADDRAMAQISSALVDDMDKNGDVRTELKLYGLRSFKIDLATSEGLLCKVELDEKELHRVYITEPLQLAIREYLLRCGEKELDMNAAFVSFTRSIALRGMLFLSALARLKKGDLGCPVVSITSVGNMLMTFVLDEDANEPVLLIGALIELVGIEAISEESVIVSAGDLARQMTIPTLH